MPDHTIQLDDTDAEHLTDATLEMLERELRRRRRERAPSRLSMSTMRRGEACELSMYLQRVTGDVAGGPAIAGRVFHEFSAAARFRMRMREEPTMDGDTAVDIAHAVMERCDEPIRGPERDAVIEWARAWAVTATVPVEASVYEVEQLWTADIEFHTLSARLDSVALIGETVEVEDDKTGQPPRNRAYIFEAFQPRFYAWFAAQRFPEAWSFTVTEKHARIGRGDTVTYTRADVEEVIDPWIRALAIRLGRAWASGRFKVQPGSWCARCPAPQRCPLPEEARPNSDTSPEAVAARAGVLQVLEARAKRERESLRTIVDLLGLDPVPVGDQVLGFTEKTKRVVMTAAQAREAGVEDDLRDAKDAIEAFKVDRHDHEFGWSRAAAT